MSCQTFKNRGYLYLSGELPDADKKAFEDHLKDCPACQIEMEEVEKLWKTMESLPSERPRPEVRTAILHRSRRESVSIWQRIRGWMQGLILQPRFVFGFSAAVAVIFIMIFVGPFHRREAPIDDALLQWDDGFISEADWMDQELDRISSGVLLASYTAEETSAGSEDWLSPMSQDLDWIRGKVEDLVKDIYGI